jgi:hypothetical protein
MKLQCLIKSRYPGAYNREMDFGALGVVQVIEGVADVGAELAAHMVASGNFVRIDEFKESIPKASMVDAPKQPKARAIKLKAPDDGANPLV